MFFVGFVNFWGSCLYFVRFFFYFLVGNRNALQPVEECPFPFRWPRNGYPLFTLPGARCDKWQTDAAAVPLHPANRFCLSLCIMFSCILPGWNDRETIGWVAWKNKRAKSIYSLFISTPNSIVNVEYNYVCNWFYCSNNIGWPLIGCRTLLCYRQKGWRANANCLNVSLFCVCVFSPFDHSSGSRREWKTEINTANWFVCITRGCWVKVVKLRWCACDGGKTNSETQAGCCTLRLRCPF